MYEPWYLRYLDIATAEAVYSRGLTLEEYLVIDSSYKQGNSCLTFALVYIIMIYTSRGGAVVARRAHNSKVAGSNPASATQGMPKTF